MEINIFTIEELVFFNKEVQRLLPEFKEYFEKWIFAKKNGGLRSIEKECLLNVLSLLQKHKNKLESYFNEKIVINKIQKNISENKKFKKHEIETQDFNEYNDFCISVNKNDTFITLWR